MIIDGREMAGEVLVRTKARAARLTHPPRILAIVANETSATKSYLAIKKKRAADAGCELSVMTFGPDTTTEELHTAVLSADADAVIVQLPLAEGMDSRIVCDAIPIGKDADVLSFAARAKVEMKGLRNLSLLPPVVGAVQKILEFGNVEIKGKQAVVIGSGFLVGAPVATWLTQQGADVSRVSFRFGDFSACKDADIIVSGAGSPHFIKPEMLRQGVVLIDAGTSESGGALAGDADPACAEKCSIFTPVPGGVGPLAVACLFENVVTLAERATKIQE
ncbi:MAG: bifunctional 5,10-methylenetetrahydrofolate dehydrogenase/5,10-methenyltetrahydrofolate cyclohydrolase [bacterium]|nr:bifunctional 5,10-methylenetetrahydrofolate dehydrogenase/5,10-methenyltetrahydrofolate cyclohydrolase [bacterium]